LGWKLAKIKPSFPMPSLIPVILAGGKGERFWPVSRQHRPKQFLSLDGSGTSLLQATANRLLPLAGGWQNLWVVTSEMVADGIREQLPHLPDSNILVEPDRRDTAAAVAWTAVEIDRRYGGNTVVGFFPADHWIDDVASFQDTLQAASQHATNQNAIATLGVKPSYPATGYGYIEQGEATETVSGYPIYRVNRFTEKPDRQRATELIETGRYSWNSGIFVFRVEVVLQQLRTYVPDIINPLLREGVAAYSQLPKTSFDYALMEQTQLATVLPVSFGWDDLGDWNALARLQSGQDKNVELAQHRGLDSQGNIFFATDENEIVVTLGLEDTIVVRDGNVTLVARKDRSQDLKKLLQQLQEDPNDRDLL
jgi:mannose-1-phosphate guanylyltransferase